MYMVTIAARISSKTSLPSEALEGQRRPLEAGLRGCAAGSSSRCARLDGLHRVAQRGARRQVEGDGGGRETGPRWLI